MDWITEGNNASVDMDIFISAEEMENEDMIPKRSS